MDYLVEIIDSEAQETTFEKHYKTFNAAQKIAMQKSHTLKKMQYCFVYLPIKWGVRVRYEYKNGHCVGKDEICW